MNAKCPKCGSAVNHLEIVGLTAGAPGATQYKAVAYVCPAMNCRAILSAQIDPIAVRAVTVDAVSESVAQLQKKMKSEISSQHEETQQFLHRILRDVEEIKKKVR